MGLAVAAVLGATVALIGKRRAPVKRVGALAVALALGVGAGATIPHAFDSETKLVPTMLTTDLSLRFDPAYMQMAADGKL